MPASSQPIIYAPGKPIDTRRPLQIENLPSSEWGEIAEAYPEVAAAGPHASFHGKRNTTIFPPTIMELGSLRRIASFVGNDRTVYMRVVNGSLWGVLIHVHGKGGGYDGVYIHRLSSTHMNRSQRKWRIV